MLNPPTDNLYKFLAIFGLIIFTAAIIYPWAKIFELQIQLAKQEVELLIRARSITEIDIKIKNVIRRIEFYQIIDESDATKASNDFAELGKLSLEREKAVIDSLTTKRETDLNKEADTYLRLGSSMGIGIGLLLIYIGFRLWYTKVQRFLDLEIQKKAQILSSNS